MAKPTFTFEDYSTPGNTLFDLYQYYLNPTDTATTTAANTGISSIFYPQVQYSSTNKHDTTTTNAYA